MYSNPPGLSSVVANVRRIVMIAMHDSDLPCSFYLSGNYPCFPLFFYLRTLDKPLLKPYIMFSGIVEEAARVVKLKKDQENLHITMECTFVDDLKIDQSVSHNVE